MGFEIEFILLKSTDPITAVNDHSWSDSLALLSGSVETSAMKEIADTLTGGGVELQMYHAEAAPGQVCAFLRHAWPIVSDMLNGKYEVVTAPLPPLESADAFVFTREVIMNVANKYGLRATLAPRVYMDACKPPKVFCKMSENLYRV